MSEQMHNSSGTSLRNLPSPSELKKEQVSARNQLASYLAMLDSNSNI
jgi:hypothetical protein